MDWRAVILVFFGIYYLAIALYFAFFRGREGRKTAGVMLLVGAGLIAVFTTPLLLAWVVIRLPERLVNFLSVLFLLYLAGGLWLAIRGELPGPRI